MRTNKLCVLLGAAACTADPQVLDALGDTGTLPATSAAADGDESTTASVDADDDSGDMGMTDDGPVGPVCGNDIIDGDDFCDGTDLAGYTCEVLGFEAGELGCTVNCGGHDLTGCGFFECGNGKEEGDEDCDGTVGAATCATEGFDNGTLFCTPACEYNFEQCGVCGDRIIDGGEDCDIAAPLEDSCQSLGLLSGTLQCGDDCLYDLSNCSTCGNGMPEANEDCDGGLVGGETCLSEGFDSGTIACAGNCQYDTTGCGTCGNALIDGDEICDTGAFDGETCLTQGFDNGALSCDATCGAISTDSCGICGNAAIDGSESCDGLDLDGETCASLGLVGGALACSPSCQFDFASCDIPGVPFGSDPGYDGFALTPPVPSCDDISATGTATGLTDDSNVVAPIGFTFPVYGVDMVSANIESNGTLRFGDGLYLSYTNSCLPTPTVPNTDTLYVFWDDLNPSSGAGEIYYQTLGAVGDQRFVVQWDVANFSGDTVDLMRFQVMLSEATGQIDVCYVDTINAGNLADSGAEATAGIQQNGLDALQFSCNTADLVDGLQLLYIPN